MRITVDTEWCTGSGQCALTAADVFDQRDEDGTVVLLQPEPPAEAHEAVRQAALLCPTRAIRVAE
ncbi:ferredoxin [Saccharopolyspora shandongensis]|uniref:ferredoxin n=1 Tax=Saccharopolyspora shandongensis TaxID=418495 RepID=UPI0033DE53F4